MMMEISRINRGPLRGVVPPLITPFQEDGTVAYTMVERNMERWNRDDLAGYLVLGSNSEAAYLGEEEKLRLVSLVVGAAGEGRSVLVGTGLESTRGTVRLTNKAAALGAHAALVLTPHYYADQMDDRALIRHFTEVAENADLPILIYNVPKFTHVSISVRAVRELSAHPRIIGMKDSTGDVPRLAELMQAVPAGFMLIVGTAAAWYPALTQGVTVGILALANCAPNQCSRIQRDFEAGNLNAARELSARLLPLNTAVTSTYGVGGLKYACSLLGYEGGCVRSPLQPVSEEGKNAIRALLKQAGLLS